jgi:hypothetical protein
VHLYEKGMMSSFTSKVSVAAVPLLWPAAMVAGSSCLALLISTRENKPIKILTIPLESSD